jgi:hypothetical protein
MRPYPPFVYRMTSVLISIRAHINLRRPLYLYHALISALRHAFINSDMNNRGGFVVQRNGGNQPGTVYLINVTTGVKRWSLLPGRFIA